MPAVVTVFGVASFLSLLTRAVLYDTTHISAIVGQRVELHCRHNATIYVDKIYWYKNTDIWFKFGFKENYEVLLNESHVKLVIPSVAENDTGFYQCGPLISFINLTVSKISQDTESSDSNHVVINLLQDILKNVFVNKILIITVLIGAGIIIVVFYVKRWWKVKYRQNEINAGYHEALLTDDFRTLLAVELQTVSEGIIARMVDLNHNVESTDFNTLLADVLSKIGNLEEEVLANHDVVVNELKLQGNNIKAIKGLQEILQKSGPSDERSISVTDTEGCNIAG